jgi:uncharacterized protein YdhG (YjbR/CyaY superfamily)
MASSIEAYIDSFPEDVRLILSEIRQAIAEEAPEAEECMNYGIPTFRLNGNLVHYAAFKKHIGFYPTPSGIEAFSDKLTPYEHAKGSVKFPLDQPIPYELIRSITRFRVKEQEMK